MYSDNGNKYTTRTAANSQKSKSKVTTGQQKPTVHKDIHKASPIRRAGA